MVGLAGHDPNITVTVDGKTYACSESGTPIPSPTNCSEATAVFKNKINTCFKNRPYSDKADFCLSAEWPKFKSTANDKQCIYFASETCFSMCAENYNYSDKADHCNKLCNLD